MNKLIKIFIFALVFVFIFILRGHGYDRSPVGNMEEMLYAWAGIYLVETGTPVSWSSLSYPDRANVFSGVKSYKGGGPRAGLNQYKPWLDEPPVFSLMIGYVEHLFGADRNDMIPTAYSRLVPVLLASLTTVMVFLVASVVSGYWIGLLAMLLYGTIPTMVIGSRMAVPENLIALTFISLVYLVIKFSKKQKWVYLLPIPFLVGISGLAKPTGYFLLPLAVFFAFSHKFYKGVAYIILGSVPFIAAFFWYGLSYDSEIFWTITREQSFRPVGFSSLAWFFVSPGYDWRIIVESWYIFGTLALAYFAFKPPEGLRRIVVFSAAYWVLVVMFSGGANDMLAWYRYPVFPFISIVAAWALVHLVSNPSFFSTFIVSGLLLGNRHLLVNAFNPNVAPMIYRIFLSLALLPSLFYQIYNSLWLRLLVQTIMILIIILGIYLNVVYIYNEFAIVCQGAECDLGPTTSLSEIYFPIIWRLLTFI